MAAIPLCTVLNWGMLRSEHFSAGETSGPWSTEDMCILGERCEPSSFFRAID